MFAVNLRHTLSFFHTKTRTQTTPRTILIFWVGAIGQKLHKTPSYKPPLHVLSRSTVVGNLSDYVHSQIVIYIRTCLQLHGLYRMSQLEVTTDRCVFVILSPFHSHLIRDKILVTTSSGSRFVVTKQHSDCWNEFYWFIKFAGEISIGLIAPAIVQTNPRNLHN